MSDVGTLHVCDFDGGIFASFRTQHGGSPCFMLPKLAEWRAARPNAKIPTLISWILADPKELGLEIVPAGANYDGHKTHRYEVCPLADLREDGSAPTIRVRYTQYRNPNVTTIDGNEALFREAAHQLYDIGNQCERIAERQEWDAKTRDQLGYNPAPLRAQAKRFADLAEKAEPAALALALDLAADPI